MTTRVLIVCGGRHYHPTAGDSWWLLGIIQALGITVVRHGACYHKCHDPTCKRESVDVWAGGVATRAGIKFEPFPVTDEDWAREGKAAGPRRNKGMLEAGDVVATAAFPGRKGTKNMARQTEGAGLPVIKHPEFHL